MSASGEGLIRLPAVTPRAPPPKSVGFQQFCDGLSTDLPVIPMVGAALIRVPGLLQGTRGPNSVLLHPWSMKLQVMLDTPTGRQSLNTYCVSVDTCWNFTRCTSWLTIVTWQSTNGKIPPCRTGLLLQDGAEAHWASQGENRASSLPHFSDHRAASCTPHLGGHLRPGCCGCCFPGLNFVLLDSDCLPVTLFVRLKIFGLKPFWPDSQLIQVEDSPRHTHCLLSDASAQILKLSTRSIVSAVRAWGRVHLWLLRLRA